MIIYLLTRLYQELPTLPDATFHVLLDRVQAEASARAFRSLAPTTDTAVTMEATPNNPPKPLESR